MNLIKNLFLVGGGIIFFGIAIVMTIFMLNINDYGHVQFGNNSLLFVNEELAVSSYKSNSLLIIKKYHPSKIEPGTKLFAYQLDRNGNIRIDYGTVEKAYEGENLITFTNGKVYSLEMIMGSVIKEYPQIGGILAVVLSQWGFLFLILIPNFLVFVYAIYSLIIEVKYGKPELN